MNLIGILDFIISAVTFYVGIYNFIIFVKNRQFVINLHFFLLCLIISIYNISSGLLYNSQILSISALILRVQFFILILLFFAFVDFIYIVINRKADIFKWIYGLASALIIISALLFPGKISSLDQPFYRSLSVFGYKIQYLEFAPGLLFNLIYIMYFIGIITSSILMISTFLKKRDKELLTVIQVLFLIFITGTIDVFTSMGVFNILYLFEFSFLFMILVMDYSLLNRFIVLFKEREHMNVFLEEKVVRRTEKIQKLLEKVSAANRELQEKNYILAELAERDSLTKLLNHAAFYRRFAEIFNLARRQGFSIAIVMMDIDNFKNINDQYGHLIGDQALKQVADILSYNSRNYDIKARYISEEKEPKGQLRNYDIAGRYGGDEFAVILPYCEEKEVNIVLDRISSCLEKIIFDKYPDLHLTISCGCSILKTGVVCKDEKKLVHEADQALLQAKKAGKNQRVIMYYQPANS